MTTPADSPDSQRWAELKAVFVQAIEGRQEDWPALVDEIRQRDPRQADELQRLLDGHLDTLIRDEAPSAQGLPPGATIGPYVVGELIGEGGMGQVYRATDERLGRDVAIKVLPRELATDESRRMRMEREARAMGMLNHPNILTVHDIGDYQGSPYIVAEFLEGQTLRQRLDGSGGLLAARDAVEVVAAVADALGAAHRRGIVHRDVKPENIFLTSDGRTKVLDFGIAKLSEAPAASPRTMTGAIIGTLGYMTPEQLRGEVAGPHTDVYSCGVVLYELLSGARPYSGQSDADLIGAVLYAEPPPIRGAGPALSALVARCLERRAEARFADGLELAAALRGLSAVVVEPEPLEQGVSEPTVDNRPQEPAQGTNGKPSTLPIGLGFAAVASLVLGGVAWRLQTNNVVAPPLVATTPDTTSAAPASPSRVPAVEARPDDAHSPEREARGPLPNRRQDRADASEPAVAVDTVPATPVPSTAPPPVPSLGGIWLVDEQIADDVNAIACSASGALQLRSKDGLLDGALKLKRDCVDSKRSATESVDATAALSTGTSTDDTVSFSTRVVEDGVATTCRYSGRALDNAKGTMTGDVSCEARAIGLSGVLSLRGTWRASRPAP